MQTQFELQAEKKDLLLKNDAMFISQEFSLICKSIIFAGKNNLNNVG